MGDPGHLMWHLELSLGGSKGLLLPFYTLYCSLGELPQWKNMIHFTLLPEEPLTWQVSQG